MATIGLNITLSGFTDDLLIVWKKNSAPLVEIGRSDPIPFPVDQIYTIANLTPEVYLVEFWRTTDGSTLDEFIKSWEIDASKNAQFGETTYEYVVNRGHNNTTPVETGSEVWADPEIDDTELNDERLIGSNSTNSYVKSRGYGRWRTDEIIWKDEGGFEFADPLMKFTDGDSFFVTVLNQTDLSPVTTAEQDYSDVKVLQDNVDNTIDFDNSFYRKLCVANFTGTVGTIVFPALSLIPDTKVKFQTHGGSQNYLKLQFNPDDTVFHNNRERNVIYLAKGEMIEFLFKDNVCYVADYDGNEKIRGTVVGDYSDRADFGAYLKADESTGVLNATNYPGLYQFITEDLAPGATIALASWGSSIANKRKWGIDTGSQTFRVPHLADSHRRFKASTEDSGTYQVDQLGEFQEISGQTLGDPSGDTADTYQGGPFKFRTKTRNTGQETRVKAYREIPLIVL